MSGSVPMYIDGAWVEGSSSIEEYAPSNGSSLGTVSVASDRDVDRAVEGARVAFPGWKALGVEGRAEIVGKAAARLVELYGEQGKSTMLKALISREVGKPIPEADIEVIESSDVLKYFAGQGPRRLAPRELQLNSELWPSKASYVTFEPVGVVAVIKPWNYPLEIPLWAIGAALVAGNTIVFKPSEHSSLVGTEITRLFVESGLPQGVLNMVTGGGAVGRSLVAHSGVDMVSFTGSASVGREIAAKCGHQLKRCSLELGGNDAAIVLPDVDLELAANGLLWGAFCNAGQVCVGTKRAFVHEDIVEELTDRIVEKTRSLRRGVDYGPLISRKQLSTVARQVGSALADGAKALTGGRRDENGDNGFYYPPTVLVDVPSTAAIMHEECFGPVLPIVTVGSIEDAVMQANDTAYGLGASVWTSDRDRGKNVASSLEAGMVWVNDVNVAFAEAPWGGVKGSGHGSELSEWGLLEFTNRKHVSVELSSDVRRDWWYPY